MNNDNIIIFSKTVKDLLIDLKTTFSDKIGDIIEKNQHYKNIINYNYDNIEDNSQTESNETDKSEEINETEFLESVNFVFDHVMKHMPENFFNLLYANEKMFEKEDYYLLPDINFSELFLDENISEHTKEAMWKYLQLISFTIITSIEDKNTFGNNQKLFEAIDSDVFKEKLEETINNMSDIFKNMTQTSDPNNANNTDPNNTDPNNADPNNADPNNTNNPFNLPNTDDIHNHINKLLNGKLGKLATEIASEVMEDMKDLNIDPETINEPKDLFNKLFKNPSQLMNLAKNVTGKLEQRIKDGSIKESEILEEVKDMAQGFGKSDLGNFKDILKGMNLDGLLPKNGKFNSNAFENMMEQNVKYSKMKERMQKKRNEKQSTRESNSGEQSNSNLNTSYKGMNLDTKNIDDMNANLAKLVEEFANIDIQKPNQSGNQSGKKRKKKK